MRNSLLILVLVGFAMLNSKAQESRTITLPMLYDAIEQNNPISGIKPILDSLKNLQIKSINTTFYPKLDVNASASWQSDVVEVNIPIPGVTIPTLDRDQYRLSLDIAQVIWDGGSTSARKGLVNAQVEGDISSIQSELYTMRDKINEAFFSLILIDITQNQLALMKEELSARLATLESGVNQGVILPSAISSLKAEIIRLEQKIIELPLRKKSLQSLLETFTGMKFSSADTFALPVINDIEGNILNRPELLTFSLQKRQLDAHSDLVSKKRMPFISAFVTSGYGKPGLNMLSNEWNPYLMAGARLTWNIWDWNVNKREREQLSIQKIIIDQRQQAFALGVENAINASENQIETLAKQLALDVEVVELLEGVKRKSESQLTNGVISSTEYLADFNAAARAKLDMEYRKILLTKEKVKARYLLGLDF